MQDFWDDLPFSTDIQMGAPRRDAIDGNEFLRVAMPEPEEGYYFLTCLWCGKHDYWNFRYSSPAMWVDYEDRTPAPPYVCNDCRAPVQVFAETLNRQEYREYLKSNHWKAVRKAAISRSLNRCQLCSSGGPLEAHHNNYRNLGRELPADVTVLCSACHRRHHGK